MIFCSERKNAAILPEIFDIKHKVTLYLKKCEIDEIKKQTSKMNDYKQSSFTHN